MQKTWSMYCIREIVINEYAEPKECASPGSLVQRIGLWEDYEVAGCLPFWHFSNNLNGLEADNNAGNGVWWLYKWRGDMSSYLPVSVANAQQNKFYSVASMDENKKCANVIFGGWDGEAWIVLAGILSISTFAGAQKVYIKAECTDYTGFHGVAEEPRIIKEGAVAAQDGKAVVPMNLYLDNDMVNLDRLRSKVSLKATGTKWKTAYQEVFLQKGINVIDLDTEVAVKLDSMRVNIQEGSSPIACIEAESGALQGEAAIGSRAAVKQRASGNGYVSGLKAANGVELMPEGDPEFTILGLGRTVDLGEAAYKNSLSIQANAPQTGAYKLVVYQSNGELFGKHNYNAQMTERFASFAVNGGEPRKVVFRNTYSDETFLEIGRASCRERA